MRAGQNNGGIILVERRQRVRRRSLTAWHPEHLEIATEDAEGTVWQNPECRVGLPRPLYAGAHGRLHRRPQPRAADRARRPLCLWPWCVLDFMKRTTFLGPLTLTPSLTLGAPARRLAEAEGLGAHARSIAIRGNR